MACDGPTYPGNFKDVEKTALTPLHKEISIYDNEGILNDFEFEFKQVHHQPGWYALLHNSGTNTLQALYYAAGSCRGTRYVMLYASCTSLISVTFH